MYFYIVFLLFYNFFFVNTHWQRWRFTEQLLGTAHDTLADPNYSMCTLTFYKDLWYQKSSSKNRNVTTIASSSGTGFFWHVWEVHPTRNLVIPQNMPEQFLLVLEFPVLVDALHLVHFPPHRPHHQIRLPPWGTPSFLVHLALWHFEYQYYVARSMLQQCVKQRPGSS